jgi:tetratricopeptide (TPR) repeat protein
MEDIDELKFAKKLLDDDLFEEAKEILLSIDIKNISNRRNVYYTLTASCFLQTNNYLTAIEYSKKALIIDSSNELASLIIYLSNVYLKDYDNAFREIIAFLKNNPVVLYKDTLRELITDIGSGAINDLELIDKIQFLANKNGVLNID